MTIRSFTSLACCAFFVGTAAIAPAAAQDAWKIGTVVAPPSMLGVIVDEIAAAITKSTDDKIKVERFQQTNEQEIAQNVIRGRYEMAYISATGIAPAIPEMGVLKMPYIWTSDGERDYVTDKYVVPFVRQIFESKGLTLVRFADAGWTNIFCKTACVAPETIKGMKVRVSPTAGDKMMFERLGANGVTMTLADFYPALQQGVVDAGTLTFGFYLIGPAAQAAPHYVFTQHSHEPAFLVANNAAWAKVSPDQRSKVDNVVLSTAQARKRIADDEQPKREVHKSKGGFTHDLTDPQRAEWVKIIVPGHEGLVAGYGGRSREFYELIMKGKAEYKASKG